MADEVIYRIIIEGQGSESEAAESPVAKTASGKKDKDFGGFVEKYVGSKLKPIAAISFAASTARMVGNIQINRVELQTGHSTLQQRAQYVHDKAWNLATSAFNGMVAGAAFGPAGAVAGALLAVTTTGIQRMLEINVAEKELRLKRQLESVTLNLANVRAGAGADRGRGMSY